jgi:hypothetical protein
MNQIFLECVDDLESDTLLFCLSWSDECEKSNDYVTVILRASCGGIAGFHISRDFYETRVSMDRMVHLLKSPNEGELSLYSDRGEVNICLVRKGSLLIDFSVGFLEANAKEKAWLIYLTGEHLTVRKFQIVFPNGSMYNFPANTGMGV